MKIPPCEPFDLSLRRICVVGTSGSGKTTMAQNLAERLHIPGLELDSVHWLPGWQERDRQETRRIVTEFASAEAWVVDGNYSFLRDILLPQAQALVWLDYRLEVILWRIWWRTMRRVFTRELLWGTNRERFHEQFFHKDSIFLWVLKTYGLRKREYSQIPLEHPQMKLYRLRTPREAGRWLEAIEAGHMEMEAA